MQISSQPKNQYLLNWINQVAALAKPLNVHICDGSEVENKTLLDLMVKSGTLTKLNRPKKHKSTSSLI